MNPQEILEKIREDRKLQIVVGVIGLILIFFLFKLFFGGGKPEKPCYNARLRIWSPFKEIDLNSLVKPFSEYCVNFEIKTKSLEEIKKDLLTSIAIGDVPDIVYIDDDYLNEFSKIFATPTPVNVDSLVAYYNKDFLNFFQLKKPRTLDDLKEFIKTVKDYGRKDLYIIGLGTTEIKNKLEIILSLMTFDPDYENKDKIKENLINAFSIYNSFSDPNNELFSYPQDIGSDLDNFAQEKLFVYLGFYQDKNEILKQNPRVNYEIYFSPLNTFPPKAKTYTKTYYFAYLKKNKKLAVTAFLNWFSKYRLKKLVEIYDLVPYNEYEKMPEDKKVVLEAYKNQGENFDFLDKKLFLENLDNLINSWQNKEEFEENIGKLQYYLWKKSK